MNKGEPACTSEPGSSSAPLLHVDVSLAEPNWEREVQHVVGIAEDALQHAWETLPEEEHARLAHREGWEVSIRLTNDDEIAELNQSFRNKCGPTNVLSFSVGDPVPAVEQVRLLGDIVVALDTVMREALKQGKTPADHTTHLLIHGLLHLLGYDHETEPDAARMEAQERRVLSALGIADPYEVDSAPSQHNRRA